MLNTTAVSSFCEFNQILLDVEDFDEFLNKYKIDLEDKEISFLNECLSVNGKGDVMRLLQVKAYEDIEYMLDGWITYYNYETIIKTAPENS